jgi:hypothetical protein
MLKGRAERVAGLAYRSKLLENTCHQCYHSIDILCSDNTSDTTNMDKNKVYYLVLHIGASMGSQRYHINRRAISITHYYSDAIAAIGSLGITLKLIKIYSDNGSYQNRFAFCFPKAQRRDTDAEKLGESFIYSLELMFMPVIDDLHSSFVFRIPAGMMGPSRKLTYKMLSDLEESRDFAERTVNFPHTLAQAGFTEEERVRVAWMITPIVYNNEFILRALMFYNQSIEHFDVSPGELRDVLSAPGKTPPNLRIQAVWENALHNAFKAIEAIVGDPPSNEAKYLDKLRRAGLDPNEFVGYQKKERISDVIRKMNVLRDKKSAHGSIANRTLTVGELLEYQSCSQYVLEATIEKELKRPISSLFRSNTYQT